jgi:hypothetical protein
MQAAISFSALAAPGYRSSPMSDWIAHFQPIVALIAGILILITPRFLNIIVAFYLILIGAVGLGVLK